MQKDEVASMLYNEDASDPGIGDIVSEDLGGLVGAGYSSRIKALRIAKQPKVVRKSTNEAEGRRSGTRKAQITQTGNLLQKTVWTLMNAMQSQGVLSGACVATACKRNGFTGTMCSSQHGASSSKERAVLLRWSL